MKYLDNNGKAHSRWRDAIAANIKMAVKREGRDGSRATGDQHPSVLYQVQEQPIAYVDPASQEPRALDFDGDLAKLNRFVIDYEAATITAYDPHGVKLAESKINERLLYGLAEQVIVDKVEELTDASPDEIAWLAAQVNQANADKVSRVVAAAPGKNCIMSPAFSNEFMECAAKNINDALSIRPVATKEGKLDIIKTTLLETEKIINNHLSQANKDEE